MIPGDRLLCAFVANQPAVGDSFSDWPLHVTIIPWFRAELPSQDLGRELAGRLDGIAPFRVSIDGESHFGFKGRKTVNLIKTPTPLMDIERQARAILRENKAWLVDETTKTRRPFMPHVTVQKSGRVHEGDSFSVDKLYIVEQKGQHKVIVEVIQL